MGSVVIVEKGSELKVGNGCKIRQSKIVVKGNYRINMEDNCIISHSSLAFYSINGLRESHIGTHTSFYGVQLQAYGSFKCGGWNIFEQKNNTPMLTVFNGSLDIGHHNRFMNRFWIRYHAKVRIGNYNNINEGSWLRADEQIVIGDYNQISYNVMIWDTNTHNIYAPSERRKLAEKYYPFFGYEYEKPPTKPVEIGSDCWIAQNVTLLKGTELGDEVMVGFGTMVVGISIPSKTTIVNQVKYKYV